MQPAPRVTEAEKTWTTVEKDEMNRFLNELGSQSKPPSGMELARRALAMARTLGREDEKNDEMAEITQRLRAANIEPLSLELYFEALFRKLNNSATMVQRNAHKAGSQVAEVRVTLSPNGSVKSFTILHSADQQAEIAFIKSVVERAAPFPVFPADIRSATDKIILQICIHPSRFSDGTGAQFTRMSRGQSCRGDG
ncbi:MAG: TonB C-terminal domain-containing protein [Hydrogenophilales bacterium]|nr:TonB C-terminal domain-containing protein [Hydrogenophilales bacterium]